MVICLLVVAILIISLILGIPMAIGLALAGLITLFIEFPGMTLGMAMQQMYTGLNSFTLLAVPMFMLGAEIMCAGECSNRLLRMMRAFLGHLPGGVAITSIGTCTLFGAISGSTQATFVAIGRPMMKALRDQDYDDSHSVGMLMNAATIALLIPPSISMVIYCVVANCSVGELFIAGIGPGLLFCLMFMAYEAVYAKRHHVPTYPKANHKEVMDALKGAILPLGFPVIILGGIYAGIFSPTEAAAVSCAYAFIVEYFIYRSITLRKLLKVLVGIGAVTAECFILVGTGQILSWVLSYAAIPQTLASSVADMGLSAPAFLALVSAVFFVGCMFMDSIPLNYVLVPIFAPIATKLGIDPIHLGLLVVVQTAVGCVTPPFGYNIFTAMAIFDLPYTTAIRKVWPYLAICIAASVILIFCPGIALFLRDLAFGA